jgi:hypothetical protein
MFPTLLHLGKPSGMVRARPIVPWAASRANVGIGATSSGVRPPSPGMGSSAQPSAMHTTYLVRDVMVTAFQSVAS